MALSVAVLGVGCGGEDDASRGGRVTVFAAASLTAPFRDVGQAFEASNSGVRMSFSFAGSPTLRTQLDQGARADALATADEPNMQAALEAGVVRDGGVAFARNALTIIVPADNPGGVETPADLAKGGLRLVLAHESVPAGAYAREALAKMSADPSLGEDFDARVLANVVSEEANVKAVVAKVQLGEADAAIVYATDVTAEISGDVRAIAIPDAYNVAVMYAIAVTDEAENVEAAEAFIAFLRSDEGRAILARHGFEPAP